jgi:hypothetical protein
MAIHICNPSYLGDRGRRTMVRSWTDKSGKHNLKNKTIAKGARDVAQVVE